MNMQLNPVPVLFDEVPHKYYYKQKELNGITGILSRQIFIGKYDNVPERILEAAKQRGHKVHGDCEMIDRLGAKPDTEETVNYVKLCKDNKLDYLDSEYIVSDLEYVASPIDKIYHGAASDEVYIADIKTTSKLDEEYLSWQLGCYKYLFELQNPKIKVAKCFGIWLRGSIAELREIQPKTKDEVIELIETDKRGGCYAIEKGIMQTADEEEMPTEYMEDEAQLYDILAEIDSLTLEANALKQKLQEAMETNDARKWVGMSLSITRKAPTKRNDFDKRKFQAEHKDLYDQYIKETEVKGSITVRRL